MRSGMTPGASLRTASPTGNILVSPHGEYSDGYVAKRRILPGGVDLLLVLLALILDHHDAIIIPGRLSDIRCLYISVYRTNAVR